jgi:hypothetical protein
MSHLAPCQQPHTAHRICCSLHYPHLPSNCVACTPVMVWFAMTRGHSTNSSMLHTRDDLLMAPPSISPDRRPPTRCLQGVLGRPPIAKPQHVASTSQNQKVKSLIHAHEFHRPIVSQRNQGIVQWPIPDEPRAPMLCCKSKRLYRRFDAVFAFFPLKCPRSENSGSYMANLQQILRTTCSLKYPTCREDKVKALSLGRLPARSATEPAPGAPELSATTASATAEPIAATSWATSAPAPVSSTSLALVLASTSATAAVVLNLMETIVASCGGNWSRGRLGGIVGPALSAVDSSCDVRRLRLSRVSRNHLERLGEGFILPSRLFVPLLRRCSIGSLGLDARCRRCIGCLVHCVADSRRSSIKLGKSCVCDSRVGNTLKRFVLGRDGLRLCNLVNPSFLCGEWSLFKGRLLDLRVYAS